VDADIAAADPRSESAVGSWSRGWIIAAGLPRPAVNRLVVGASGRTYFGDLVWDDYGVIGEADSLGKYGRTAAEARQAMRSERDRQADLEAAGWSPSAGLRVIWVPPSWPGSGERSASTGRVQCAARSTACEQPDAGPPSSSAFLRLSGYWGGAAVSTEPGVRVRGRRGWGRIAV